MGERFRMSFPGGSVEVDLDRVTLAAAPASPVGISHASDSWVPGADEPAPAALTPGLVRALVAVAEKHEWWDARGGPAIFRCSYCGGQPETGHDAVCSLHTLLEHAKRVLAVLGREEGGNG